MQIVWDRGPPVFRAEDAMNAEGNTRVIHGAERNMGFAMCL